MVIDYVTDGYNTILAMFVKLLQLFSVGERTASRLVNNAKVCHYDYQGSFPNRVVL